MNKSTFKRKKTLIYNYLNEVFCNCPKSILVAKTETAYITLGNNVIVRIADHPKHEEYNGIQIIINPFNNYYTLIGEHLMIPLTFNQMKLMLYGLISEKLNTIGGTITTQSAEYCRKETNDAVKSGKTNVYYVFSEKCESNPSYYITHNDYVRLTPSGKSFVADLFKNQDYAIADLLYVTKAELKTIKKYLPNV